MENKTGKAYGFFYCEASHERIKNALPIIRKDTKTPFKLEHYLIEDADNLECDERLRVFAQDAKEDGLNYVLQINYPNGSNLDAANEMAPILTNLAHSNFYEDTPKFHGAIVYEDNGKYIFRE